MQKHDHLTTPPTFAGRIAAVITDIVIPLEEDAEAQLRQLRFVEKLWAVIKDEFVVSWLSTPAETILAVILKRSFILSHEGVKDVWSRLCADLMSYGISGLEEIVSLDMAHQAEVVIQRKLWTLCAKTWQASEDQLQWKNVVFFLTVPFGCEIVCLVFSLFIDA